MTGPPSPKRQRTGDKPEAASIDAEKLQSVLDKLAPVNESIEAENAKMAGEVLVIESKYNKVKRPFFEKRATLLREIPGFWKQVLNNHPYVAISIAEEEQPILDYLRDVDVKFTDDNGGFKIELTFGENPYFANKTLAKQVTFKEDDEVESESTEIEWKTTSEATSVKEHISFFERLASDEGEAETEFAELIKDEVWKDPVPVYLNADASDDEGDDDEEGDDDDDEEDESAEDEE